MKIVSIVILFLYLCLFLSLCSPTENLGNGYMMSHYDIENDDIYHNHHGVIKTIPRAILRYGYNHDFIIAEQRPPEYLDAYLDERVDYPHGRDTVYYWIIRKQALLRIGPLTKEQFENARKVHNVPDDLQLESYWQTW